MKRRLCLALTGLLSWSAFVTAAEDNVFRPTAPKERTITITTSRKTYTIPMGGTADMENATTRYYHKFVVAFQPNLSLTIENTGKRPIVNPRIITNEKRRWWRIEEIIKEATAGAKTELEKALFIWHFVFKNRHHDAPIFRKAELHDPVKMLNLYGGGLCDDSAWVTVGLWHSAGLNKEKIGGDPMLIGHHGHVSAEAFANGAPRYLDPDLGAFYLDLENERPASHAAVVRDHHLARRDFGYGPLFRTWKRGDSTATLFGRDDSRTCRSVTGHRMDMTLRPGEKMVYRWDNIGKIACNHRDKRRFWGNSLHVYKPRLDKKAYRGGVSSEKAILPVDPNDGDGKLAGASKNAHLVYEMRSPYVVCGGRVKTRFHGLKAKDQFEIAVSLDGKKWRKAWSAAGKGTHECNAETDDLLEVRAKKKPAKYRYFVRVKLASAEPGSARLSDLKIESDLMASPHALPRLSLGKNKVVYTDETKGPHEVTITHRWRESSAVTPPAPPAAPEFPRPGAAVAQSTFEFKWQAVKDANLYHVQVSRGSDMCLPYRPCFDVYVKPTSYGSPFTGVFSPDTDYYWRVRCRNKEGVWGKWSKVWRFRWDGPRVPVNLSTAHRNGEIWLTWQADRRGPRPAYYEVYGSDERGFLPSKKARQLSKRRLPANFLGKTTETAMLIVSPASKSKRMNKSFYRVVAVDKNGTESGPSDFLELPQPCIFSRPVTTATVGKPYTYALRTLRCIGDAQHRYTKGTKWREEEECKFTLATGPKWLKLDPKTGVLSGAPKAKDMGTAEVTVTAKRLYPHEVKPSEKKSRYFQKTAAEYHAAHQQRFRIEVRAE